MLDKSWSVLDTSYCDEISNITMCVILYRIFLHLALENDYVLRQVLTKQGGTLEPVLIAFIEIGYAN